MTVAVTYEERIALIRKIAERKKKMATIKTKSRSLIDHFDKYEEMPQRVSKVVEEDKTKNDNYWTDAPKYAEQYYGETYRATTRYDNEWE